MQRASRCQEFLSFDKRIQYCLGAVHTGKGRAEKSATAVHKWTCRRVNTDELSCPFRDAHAGCLRCKLLDHVRDPHADGLHCCCHACPGVRESVTFMLDQTSRGGVDPELLWNQTCFWSLWYRAVVAGSMCRILKLYRGDRRQSPPGSLLSSLVD